MDTGDGKAANMTAFAFSRSGTSLQRWGENGQDILTELQTHYIHCVTVMASP